MSLPAKAPMYYMHCRYPRVRLPYSICSVLQCVAECCRVLQCVLVTTMSLPATAHTHFRLYSLASPYTDSLYI